MIDLRLKADDISTIQNSTLIRLLIEYRHAGAMLDSCRRQENDTLRTVLQQSARTIEQELLKRETASSMVAHLNQEGISREDARGYVTLSSRLQEMV